MKKLAIALAALLSLAGSAQAQTTKDLLAALLVKWNKPTEPFKIIDNVYYVGSDGLASYLIATPQGLILVDTIMPESTSLIKASIEKLGFEVADIKYLLNTHAHIDHTGGFAELKQASGAQMVSGEADKPLLEGGYYPGAQDDDGAEVSAGEGGSHRSRRRHRHIGQRHPDGPFNTRTFAGLHELGLFGEGGRRHALGPDLLQRDGGAEPSRRQPDLPRHRRRLSQDLCARQGHEGRYPAAPHPEMYNMQDKRAVMTAGAPNPFVNPGEFDAYAATLEKAFEDALTKQTAAAQEKKG